MDADLVIIARDAASLTARITAMVDGLRSRIIEDAAELSNQQRVISAASLALSRLSADLSARLVAVRFSGSAR